MLDISLGVEERMFLGSCWYIEWGGTRAVVVLGVRTFGDERSIALEMLGSSDLGREVVGFLGSRLDLESFTELVLLVFVMLTTGLAG